MYVIRWLKEREARSHIRDTLHHFPACSPLLSFAVIRSLTHHSDHASQLPSYISLKNNVELTVSSVSNTAKRRDDHRNAIELYHQRIVSVRFVDNIRLVFCFIVLLTICS